MCNPYPSKSSGGSKNEGYGDAAISYHQPIVVLMNVSKVLKGSENKKEVISDLLSNMAPLIDESCSFSTLYELEILSQNPSKTTETRF
jgi:hypothetical protein